MSIPPTTRALVLPADAEGIRKAAGVLRGGGLVAFPTETVYGLGANAGDAEAVQRVFVAKGRPADNPLIVHVADSSEITLVAATVPPLAQRLAAQFWPGPLTLVVDAAGDLPQITTGGLATVGVRMPAHSAALAFLEAAGVPVAAPSANRSGRPSPTTAAHVLVDLEDQVDVVLDGGPCALGLESTVVDARGLVPVILREGAVTREQLGLDGAGRGHADFAASPGTRHRHYAPRCRVEIAPVGQGAARATALARNGVRVGLVATGKAGPSVHQLAQYSDAAELGRLLYGALRAAEDAAIDVVIVEAVPAVGIGRAVMDRVRRAAAG